MDSANFKIHGNIIDELSNKIPTYIVAINELIKNSYDADATEIKINVDTENNIITFIDNGDGMDKNNMDSLFHISKSDKKFGKIKQNGRYIQGSKGLGFLAVFKLGETVTWYTKKYNNKGYQFSVNFNKIKISDNISEEKIELISDDNIEKGTRIKINTNKDILEDIIDIFEDREQLNKILYCFNDDNINIICDIDGKKICNKNKINLKNIFEERQLYYIKYSSEDHKIEFYFRGSLIGKEDFEISDNRYSLDIELSIFHLAGYSKAKEKIDKLFYYDNKITPLIYINNNLFNNYNLFNPEIMRKAKNNLSLPQMIGYVNIYSDNKDMDFNSDRTNFIQNELTKNIKEDLKEINIKIQTYGSKIKQKYVKIILNQNKIIDEFPKKDYNDDINDTSKSDDNQNKDGTSGTSNLDDNQNKNGTNGIPKSDDNQNKDGTNGTSKSDDNQNKDGTNGIPKSDDNQNKDGTSGTSNLDDNQNKNGINGIPKSDDNQNKDGTNGTSKSDDNKNKGAEKPGIIPNRAHEDYKISYNYIIQDLVTLINNISKSNKTFETYKTLIACSLRVIYEISIQKIIRTYKNIEKYFKVCQQKQNKISLSCKVKLIIELYKKLYNRDFAILININIENVNNILDEEKFMKYVQDTNLGSHSSIEHLTDDIIKGICGNISYFIINEMVNNDNVIRKITNYIDYKLKSI